MALKRHLKMELNPDANAMMGPGKHRPQDIPWHCPRAAPGTSTCPVFLPP